MGDANATSFPLPPGVRFHPSDEELLRHYLSGKNAEPGGARAEGNNLIGELDLYSYDPFELPSSTCYAYGCGGKKRHWFCYTGGGAVRERGGKRRAKSGFWRRKGRVRIVMGRGGRGDLGTRTKFVFYLGNSAKTAFRTNWVLYEYAPIDHLKVEYLLFLFVLISQSSLCFWWNYRIFCWNGSLGIISFVLFCFAFKLCMRGGSYWLQLVIERFLSFSDFSFFGFILVWFP